MKFNKMKIDQWIFVYEWCACHSIRVWIWHASNDESYIHLTKYVQYNFHSGNENWFITIRYTVCALCILVMAVYGVRSIEVQKEHDIKHAILSMVTSGWTWYCICFYSSHNRREIKVKAYFVRCVSLRLLFIIHNLYANCAYIDLQDNNASQMRSSKPHL